MAKSRSTPPTAAQKRLAAERAAAARERIQAAQRRRRLWVILSSVGAVIVIVAVLVVVKVVIGGNELKSGKQGTSSDTTVTAELSSVPASVFDQIGIGSAIAAPEPMTSSKLSTGKPEILYVGAEFCPICAAERWPLAVALSRFGTFQNIGTTFSSGSDTNPDTPTLTFHGATYQSKYLTFVAKEIYTNKINSAKTYYTPLDTLTSAQSALFSKYGKDSFPFVDFNGVYDLRTWQYDGKILLGQTQLAIAKQASSPSTTISKAVIGGANVLSARICQLTGQKPASVCSSTGVTVAAKALAKSSSGS